MAAADPAAETDQDKDRVREFADRAEQAAREKLYEARERAREAYDEAYERFDAAQRYIVERVQERPLQSTLAAVGVGVILGMMLSGRRR